MFIGYRRRRMAVAVFSIALVSGSAGWAQTPSPALPTPAVTAGWNDGFVIQSADGDNRLQIGLTLQADGRFSLDDPRPITNTFLLRKARPTFTGRIGRYFDFKVMPELAGGNATLLDGYFDIRFSSKFRVRSGKDKTPVGYELLLGDAYLIFPERSVVSLLVPNRDVGFQALGELAGGKVLYSGGIFNGQPLDGASTTTDIDVNEGKDLAGRIVVMPFRSSKTPSALLNNLGFHLGGSTGNQNGPLPSFRTTAGQTIFGFAPGALGEGRRNRVTPAVFIYAKGFGAFAEYARTSQDVTRTDVRSNITNHAWQVTASYVLTGEATSDRGVKPKATFDPAKGTWGAVQIAARYGELTFDDRIFAAGLATTDASRTLRQTALGVDWFLTNYVKIYATYERLGFDGPRESQNLIIFRSQLAF